MKNGSIAFMMSTSRPTTSPVKKNAVLFGNGLIRTLGSPSSIDLLKETICPPCNKCEGYKKDSYCPFRDQEDYLPFPLIYEYLILKKQRRPPKRAMNQVSSGVRDQLKKKLEAFTPQQYPDSVLHHLAALPADDYLTTNYDTFLAQILESQQYGISHRQNSETKYSIRRHVCMEKERRSLRIWNIHGTYHEKPSSFTIQYGYEHYCGCIGKIDDYLKGTYTYEVQKQKKEIASIPQKLRDRKLQQAESWIDLFFFSNVYIIGLNLSSEEIDLLYILNFRARWLRDSKTGSRIQNRIVFYGQPAKAMKALLEEFDVEVCSASPKPPGKNAANTEYADYYKAVLRDIQSRIEQEH
ncbi:SIR2 family protein [uncultured Akkermansia sp.]|uniref:SIR2 family protein n=1 Tax=uncultured Akkermansia sp. TaxID=512294 RepID=UPI00265CB60C|nr:SIR2 family protein [uncultured Akkermansia sp.]